MQSRIRENRSINRITRFGKCKAACFKKIRFEKALIPLLLIISSCSTFNKPISNQNLEIISFLNKTCLSSDGKGRLKSKAGKHLFRYESLLTSEEKSWQMALQVPVHGEKLMTLSWEGNGKAKIRGSFYHQVMHALSKEKKSKYQKNLLDRFLRFITFIAKLKTEVTSNKQFQINCADNTCTALSEEFTWYQNDSQSLIKQKINDRLSLAFKGTSDSAGYFEKLSFVVENTRENFSSGNPLELNLFLASCDSKK